MIVSARLTSTGACFKGKEANDSDYTQNPWVSVHTPTPHVSSTLFFVAFCNVIVLLARALRMKSTRRVCSEKCSVVGLRDCKKKLQRMFLF